LLSDQIKRLDGKAHHVAYKAKVLTGVLADTQARTMALFGL